MYKLKKYLPLAARLQIYHSLVQSHLNYCSLLWGFASKAHIESLFCKQKMGLRAAIPGFANYWYKNGTPPAHTKSHFKEHNILTVHGIIVKNTLINMQKLRDMPQLLPYSTKNLIPSDRFISKTSISKPQSRGPNYTSSYDTETQSSTKGHY